MHAPSSSNTPWGSMSEGIRIVRSDFRDVDPNEWAQAQAQVTDPAYSEHVHKNATTSLLGGGGARRQDLGFGHLTRDDRDYLRLIASVIQGHSVFFADFEGSFDWIREDRPKNLEYLRAVPWVRWAQPQKSGDRPGQGFEMTIWFHPKGRKQWWGHGGWTHWGDKCLRGKKDVDKHATQKPLPLITRLVSAVSRPGGLVVDACGGWGTTALACRILGRRCLCVEVNPDHCERARERLAAPLSDLEAAGILALAEEYEAETERTIKANATPKSVAKAKCRANDARRMRAALP